MCKLFSLPEHEAVKLWVQGAGFRDEDAQRCGWWYPNYVRALENALEEREKDTPEDEDILVERSDTYTLVLR